MIERFQHPAWFYSCISLLLGSIFYNHYVPVVTRIVNTGMAPIAQPEDIAISKPNVHINRNDIVIVTSGNTIFINRVFAVPGDNVKINYDNIEVNGERTLSGIFENYNQPNEYKLAEDLYLVGVDNRITGRLSLPNTAHRALLRKVVDILRISDFAASDWVRLVFCTIFMAVVVVVPYLSFVGRTKSSIFRKLFIIPHSIVVLLFLFLFIVDLSQSLGSSTYQSQMWKIPFLVFSASDERILHEIMFFLIFHSTLFYWPLLKRMYSGRS